MAIVVEDGTGLSNAQAYASLSELNSYLLERNKTTVWSDTEKEAALVISAKDWIDGEHEFSGSPLNSDQSLKFPRDIWDGVPKDIVKANVKAAFLQLNSVLLPDPTQTSINGDIVSVRKKLDVLESEIVYAEGTSKRYSMDIPSGLQLLIKPYLKQSTGFGRNVRLL